MIGVGAGVGVGAGCAKVQIGLRPVQRCKSISMDWGRGGGRGRHANSALTPECTCLGIFGRDLRPEVRSVFLPRPLPRPLPLTCIPPLHFCTRLRRSCTFALPLAAQGKHSPYTPYSILHTLFGSGPRALRSSRPLGVALRRVPCLMKAWILSANSSIT